ncbi:transposase [Acetobacter malorum]|uniref:transposase n=1 Tax=Acetobacter malorum TaxID=178901 RepID=UPI0039EC7172
MTERSEQNDACVAATFAATQASRALHPVIEIVGERRRAYDDAFRRRVVLASYETGQSVRAVARQFGVHVSHQRLSTRSHGGVQGQNCWRAFCATSISSICR